MRKIIFYLAGNHIDREDLYQKISELEKMGFSNSLNCDQVESLIERMSEHLAMVAEENVQAIHSADLIIILMDDVQHPY